LNRFLDFFGSCEACVAIIAVLQIQNVQPLALVLQGVPSGSKTAIFDFFRKRK
jgi:hypothetical protein